MIIISHYTLNTPYVEEKKNLEESLENLGLRFAITGIDSLGSWRANSNFCSEHIRWALAHYKEDVLRVDCDAVFYREPGRIQGELAACIWKDSVMVPEGELLGGTLYFKYCSNTLKVVEDWVEECDKFPKQRNGDLLKKVIKRSTIDFTNLPLQYCKIFDLMENVDDPIIEHFQVSRKFKKVVNAIRR